MKRTMIGVLLALLQILPALSQYENYTPRDWKQLKAGHTGIGLSDRALQTLDAMDDHAHFRQVLAPIMVPRQSGTQGNVAVKDYLVSTMRGLGWDVQEDSFTTRVVPDSREVRFTNVIATLDPRAPRRLVLACHFDSLGPRDVHFVAATDSAVPCAQLINLAHVLRNELKQHSSTVPALSIQFMFFDGEEAFVSWSDTDSTYGSRHLASKLASTGYGKASQLDRIDLFVLLDLLGVKDQQFLSFFPKTQAWYERLMSYETRLNSSKSSKLYRAKQMFTRYKDYRGLMQDDHIPFLRRDVPVLHIIPPSFPRCWHKDCDDASSLHHPSIARQNVLWRALVADYLHLNVSQGRDEF